MPRFALRFSAVLAVLVAMLSSAAGFADGNTQDQAAARALFEQARKLVEQKKFSEACPKFEESERLDPGTGTRFNLADCYEQTGKTASAWSLFLEVASDAVAAKRPDKESAARTRADALKPKLSNLVIRVEGDADLQGLVIKRDGTAVGRPIWGSPVPVDPGKHQIEASAPGKKAWTGSITVAPTPGDTTLKVPALETDTSPAVGSSVAPTSNAPDADFQASAGTSSNRRLIGLVVGGVGVAAFGVGTVLAFSAKSKFNDASSHCTGNQCDEAGAQLRHDAVKGGNIATILGGVGLAALATGVVLYLTAPSNKPATAERPSTSLALGPGSILVTGSW